MSSMTPLTAREKAGLNKVGDVYFPGDGQAPSFSRLGCVDHADVAISYLPDDDRSSLRLLLSILGLMPASFARLLVNLGERGPTANGPWGVALRFLRLGLKGVVTSLYYSGEKGANYSGPTPLDVLEYRVSVYTGDKTEEDGSVAACRGLSG